MTSNKPALRLTQLDLDVLRGAQAGKLWRSESGHDLYASYLDGKKVNRQVDKLTAGAEPLLRIGERERFSRPWLLTDTGKAELARHAAKVRGLKAYTLGINGFVRRGILTAIGAPNHVRQANVVIVAHTKVEAASLASDYGCGHVTVSDPEFRVAGSPYAESLLAYSTSPQVYVTALTAPIGTPVVAVDDAGPRRVGTTGPRGTFVPDQD